MAGHELGKAFKFLKTLKFFFVLSALGSLLVLASLMLVLHEGLLEFSTAAWVIAIYAISASIQIAGIFQLYFRPFFWAVVLASMTTLNRAVDIANSSMTLVPIVLYGGWALFFWLMTLPTARVRRLMDAHPDLSIIQNLTGGPSRRSSSDRKAMRRKLAFAEGKARNRSLVAAVGIMTVSFGFTGYVYFENSIPAFQPVWDRFEAEWRAGHLDRVVGFADAEEKSEMREWLTAVREHRDWRMDWPLPVALDHGAVHEGQQGEGRITVLGATDAGHMSWTWRASKRKWRLTSVSIPDPPFDLVAASWVDHWDRSDFEGLAGLFLAPDKGKSGLRRLANKREWDELPETRTSTMEESGVGFRLLEQQTWGGLVLTRWRLEQDHWKVITIKPPPL